jgi:hypothetical protein
VRKSVQRFSDAIKLCGLRELICISRSKFLESITFMISGWFDPESSCASASLRKTTAERSAVLAVFEKPSQSHRPQRGAMPVDAPAPSAQRRDVPASTQIRQKGVLHDAGAACGKVGMVFRCNQVTLIAQAYLQSRSDRWASIMVALG